MLIDTEDHGLSRTDRQLIRQIAFRLNGGLVVPPKEYRDKAEALAPCDEGDLEKRGDPQSALEALPSRAHPKSIYALTLGPSETGQTWTAVTSWS